MVTHRWSFFRAGGFDQVKLESGADLAALDQLDQKLWVALSCPTSGLEFDAATLALIDSDKDGHIRASELIAATKWACANLKQPDDLLRGAATLPLAAINDSTTEGKQILAAAGHVLASLGKADATEISAEDTADTAKVFAQTKFNGDGVLPPEAADDEAIKTVINEIMTCLGSQPDRSGKPGIGQEAVDRFFTEAAAFSEWWKRAEDDATLLPLGPATTAAADTVRAARAKIDDYFARCQLAAFDARAVAALNREEKEYLALAAKDLTITHAEIAALPLARIEAARPLPLAEGVNPAWAAALAKLRSEVVAPLLGDRPSLSEGDWATLNAKLGPHEAWIAAKAGAVVEPLGLVRVRQILAGDSRAKIGELIVKDTSLEEEFNALAAVDKLVRLHRDLYKLLNNYVSFRTFYSRKEKAIFQAGTLYLDQRSCELCIRVGDATKHGLMAHLSRAYLAYCDCTRQATGEKMTIVAAFSGGSADNLMVGRNGVFYDRKGKDWDATITKIVDNPISIRQAFWSPYKRTLRMIEDQVAKRATAADAEATDKLISTATKAATAPPAKPGTPGAPTAPVAPGKEPPPKPKFDVGVVAALGVAVGGITAALGMLLQAFFGLGIWMPIGFVGLILLISGPSMLIAWLKLRQRNLGPLLDANGWALNANAKINIPFGGSLTGTAKLPRGSRRDLVDPFAEHHGKRNMLIVVILLALVGGLWYLGQLDRLLPARIRSTTVLGAQAPAATPAIMPPAPPRAAPK
jgi:hypothetical protein